MYVLQGKIRRAKSAFRNVIEINPRYAEAHYQLGATLLNEGELEDALESFRQAVEVAPRYANAYYGAGLAFIGLNRPSEALRVLQYARELYQAEGNTQWLDRTDRLLQQIRWKG